MRPLIPAAIIAAAALAACEAPSPLVDRSGVAEATPAEVANCTAVNVITTTPGVSGTIGLEKTLEISRNETKEKARAAGADTVVWENGGPGSGDLFIRAQTYRCL